MNTNRDGSASADGSVVEQHDQTTEVINKAGHLFLSYNSHNREKVLRVKSYLERLGIPLFFDQQSLMAGRNWPQALEKGLKDSFAVAVFVGSEFGRWQLPEIGFALDRQAHEPQFPVIPVLLDGADTSRSFLFLNTWVDLRGEAIGDAQALQQLVDALSGLKTGSQVSFIDVNPYRGLKFFDEADAPFFFGRETFVNDLVQRLTEQCKNFVAVIGPSGSGKSSVVRAGLIPQLRRRRPPHETWDIAVFTPGIKPWLSLAAVLGPLQFPEKDGAELVTASSKLTQDLSSGDLDLDFLLNDILRRQEQGHHLLLVVDQFEELFIPTLSQEGAIFIEKLVGSLASIKGLVVIPVLRADFYGQAIEANRQFSDLLSREQVTLGRLTDEELRESIEEPARMIGLEFEAELAKLLLRDAGNEPGNLPLLQHALSTLYEKRNGRRMTHEAYQAFGGIRQAIPVQQKMDSSIGKTKGKVL